jgi:DNA-binding Lrp family transcriptional regulator
MVLKDSELRLISELMKNSRRSDRELGRVLGISQPTVSRMIKKLEKEGVIQEYTMIPDFAKLGFQLMGLTFLKLKKPLKKEETEKVIENGKKAAKSEPFAALMRESGLGFGYDGVMVTLYQNYTEYCKHMDYTRQFGFLEAQDMESFLISLGNKVRFRPLTLSTTANYLSAMREKKE